MVQYKAQYQSALVDVERQGMWSLKIRPLLWCLQRTVVVRSPGHGKLQRPLCCTEWQGGRRGPTFEVGYRRVVVDSVVFRPKGSLTATVMPIVRAWLQDSVAFSAGLLWKASSWP